MTATDVLRRLLDERGVEWSRPSGLNSSFADSITFIGDVAVVGEIDGSDLLRINFDGTPEQAIAATLGETPTPPPPTPPKQPPYDELIESLRRDWGIDASWDGLRRFWYVGLTDEGVRKRDEREATLGRGTCHDVRSADHTIAFECSECGCWVAYDEYWETGIYVPHETGQEHIHPRYCPNCGREVVE